MDLEQAPPLVLSKQDNLYTLADLLEIILISSTIKGFSVAHASIEQDNPLFRILQDQYQHMQARAIALLASIIIFYKHHTEAKKHIDQVFLTRPTQRN